MGEYEDGDTENPDHILSGTGIANLNGGLLPGNVATLVVLLAIVVQRMEEAGPLELRKWQEGSLGSVAYSAEGSASGTANKGY